VVVLGIFTLQRDVKEIRLRIGKFKKVILFHIFDKRWQHQIEEVRSWCKRLCKSKIIG